MILIIPQIKILGISGITLYPFIILRDKHLKQDKQIMNHEQIHIHQQMELLVVPFYVIYLLEFAIGIIKHKSIMTAYLNISFEQEAYKYDADFTYLSKRKVWAWRNF